MFSLSLLIHALIALIVLLPAETIGLWFVNNKLIIPPERMGAARWIYQFSIVSFVFTIMVSPFMAAIIAHEDMNIYAAISIAEAVLKLAIVLLLKIIPLDKLQLYGILLCAVTAVNTGIYWTTCKRKYQECRFRFYWSRELFREITGFTGWNLFGAAEGIFKNQLVNILLNQFFNPLVIAARGIASSVNGVVTNFSQNFSSALRPQITKSYAAGYTTELKRMVFSGSKTTYFLMYIFILPLILETPVVLSLWLKNVPEYTVVFTRVILIDALIESISYPIASMVQATGKIKLYQSVTGGFLLLNLPLSWLVLFFGGPPYSVALVAICLTFIAFIMRLLISRLLINYSVSRFFREVILPICLASLLSMILPMLSCYVLEKGVLRVCIVTCISILSNCVCMYFIGLNRLEREKLKSMTSKKLKHIFKAER
jgi:O-antigen/teichoic acid export membrane protein